MLANCLKATTHAEFTADLLNVTFMRFLDRLGMLMRKDGHFPSHAC